MSSSKSSSSKSNGKKATADSASRVVARNRRARHDYEIIDELDCGIMLIGSEVKSIRDNKITIDEAFARVEGGEVFLYNVDIAEFPQASYLNHERKRTRKLLLRKREIAKFAETAQQQGMTLIPLEIFFSRGIVKVKLAVAKGRKVHDKRDRIKSESDRREMRDAVKKRMS
jgi:SsrA-binding protein